MSKRLLNIILLTLFTVTTGTIVLIQRDYGKRNSEWLPGMFTSDAYSPQSSNRNFSDGRTAQRPVTGTVVRSFEPFPYGATAEEAIRAGRELSNPVAPTSENVSRGMQIFGTMCSPCHGAGGNGDGLITLHGFPPPPSLFAQNAMTLKDGQIFHIITYGQKNMPSLAPQVLREDRWKAVLYIRSLQAAKKQLAKK